MSVSTHFREVSRDEAKRNQHKFAWQSPSIPAQQWDVVKGELERWKAGQPFPLYDVVRSAASFFPISANVLDVGCGAGHYYDVLKDCIGEYIGVDYNPEFIRLALDNHPDACCFSLADAYNLGFSDRLFDAVLHSGCLLHLFDWEQALVEAMRVTKRCLVLHRTPVSMKNRTQYFLKEAYGVECLEIWFAEMDLFDILSPEFELRRVWRTSGDINCTYQTYLLERR